MVRKVDSNVKPVVHSPYTRLPRKYQYKSWAEDVQPVTYTSWVVEELPPVDLWHTPYMTKQ
jgi:hypothetical protein